MDLDLATRPLLPASSRKRAEHQALRMRLLSGLWAQDAEKALEKHIAADRLTAWGIPELSRNPFRSIASQVGGALYQANPTVYGPTGADALARAAADGGLWAIQQRASTDLVGLRETLLRVDWSERGGLLYRPIPLDLVHVEAVAEAPDVPALVEEVQERIDPETGKPAWFWEILDIRDLANPLHRILSADRSKDWTAEFLGGDKSGENYQYRDSAGRPYLPVVMHHAERTGRLFDPYFGVEAVLGTLTISVLLTFWLHGVKDGSFATVMVAGGRLVGVEIESPSGNRTQVISTEPGSVIEIAPIEGYIGQIQVTQVQPGMDPERLMSAIGMFEAGLAEYAGVSPSDLLRTGADPRSGVSLTVSREGLRGSQARYEPSLRRGDVTALEVTAKVLNRATGTSYPEAGLSVAYPSLPLSTAEIQAQREDVLAKVQAGFLSRVDGYVRLNPGLSREQAMQELRRIQAENAMFPAPPPTTFGI